MKPYWFLAQNGPDLNTRQKPIIHITPLRIACTRTNVRLPEYHEVILFQVNIHRMAMVRLIGTPTR